MSGFAGSSWQLAFQSAPIILTGGMASAVPGGYLPLIALTEGLSLAGGALSGTLPNSQNDFFAQFYPIPGSNLISNALGQYPFANQEVAANAIIKQPLSVSMLMISPVRKPGGYWTKMAEFSALKATLDNHNSLGGTYMIITPAYPYENCILLGVTDVTGSDRKQKQVEWQWDFQKPLISLSAASTAYSSLISKLENGGQVTSPSWSGAANAIGYPLQAAAASFTGISSAATSIGSYVSSSL